MHLNVSKSYFVNSAPRNVHLMLIELTTCAQLRELKQLIFVLMFDN